MPLCLPNGCRAHAPGAKVVIAAALAAICLTLDVPPAAAQMSYTWTAAASGNFSDPSRWLGGAAPPVGGDPAGTLRFAAPGLIFVATNDRGDPALGSPAPFRVNRIEFAGNTVQAGVASAAGHTLQLTGAAPSVAQMDVGNAAISSTLNLAPTSGGATVSAVGAGNLTFSGVISGAGGLTVTGLPIAPDSAVITLGAANTFTGGVTLNSGNLAVGNNNALGATGNTLTVNGGTLQATGAVSGLAANVVLNRDLTLVGTPTSAPITFGPSSVISGGGGLVLRTPAATNIQSASTYGGATTIDLNAAAASVTQVPGTLTISGTSGAALNSPAFNVRAGGVLILKNNDPGSTVNNDRIRDDAAVNLRGGEFQLSGTGSNSPGVPTAEAVGAVTGAGYSTVTAFVNAGGGGNVRLTAASLTRVERGTFLFRGSSLGDASAATRSNIFFTTAPTGLVGGGPAVPILPYALGPALGFVTYDLGPDGQPNTGDDRGVRPLDAATEYAATLAANANVMLASPVVNAGPVTVNALALTGTGSVTGPGTITVTSGAVAGAGSGGPAVIANALNFGGAEANVFAFASSLPLTFTGNLSGTNGLTKSASGRLVLSGDNTGLTGPLTINDGQVSFASLASLPGTGAIVVNGKNATTTGAGLAYTGRGAAALGRDLQVNTGIAVVNVTDTAGALTLGGSISGVGGLYNLGRGKLTLSGANTFTGPLLLEAGTLAVSSDANLGNGPLNLFGGTLLLGGSLSSSRAVQVTSPTGAGVPPPPRVDTNGFDLTWAGPVTGTGPFEKRGAGTLTIMAGSNPYSGVVTAYGGTLRLAGKGAIRAAALAAAPGGTLELDNTGVNVAPSLDRVNDGATVALAGGTLRLVGSASVPVTEGIGQLALGLPGSVVEVQASGGQTAALVVTGLNSPANAGYDHRGGTVEFRGTNLGAAGGPGVSVGRVFIPGFTTDAPVPGATARDLTSGTVEQALYDATNGVGVRPARVTGPGADFVTVAEIRNPANGGAVPVTANVRTTAATPTGGSANTVASLRMAPGSGVDIIGGGTLSLSSGVVYVEPGAGTTPITGGTLTAGAAALRVTAHGDTAIGATVAGTGGFVKDGAGDLSVTGAFTTTGGTFLHGGTLTFSGPVAGLGVVTTTGGTLTGGGAALTANGALSATRLVYNGGAIPVPLELPTDPNGSFQPLAAFNVSGAVAGGFVLTGSGSAIFAQDRLSPGGTFAKQINLTHGQLAVTDDSAFGAVSDLSFQQGGNGSTPRGGLRFDASFTTARNLNIATDTHFDTPAASTTATLNSQLNSSGRIIKDGPGTVVLEGTNSIYSGAVDVKEGRLLVNGVLPAETTGTVSPVTVFGGATLGGTGTVNRTVAVQPGGTLAPGASPGTLTITRAVTLTPGSAFAVELNGTAAGSGYDQLSLAGGGSIDLGGATLVATANYAYAAGDTATIITGGTVVGTFAGLPSSGSQFLVPNSAGGPSPFLLTTVTYNSTSVVLTFQPVPEPAHALFFVAGGAGLGRWVWRRRKAKRRHTVSHRLPAGSPSAPE
jgi:autotransporter-associated beta strand protein